MFDSLISLFWLWGLLYMVLYAYTNYLSFSYPFFIMAFWFKFYTYLWHSELHISLDTCTISGLEHTKFQCKNMIGFISVAMDPFITPSLPGLLVIIIKNFLHLVLNFFHNFSRILSNVNFMNGQIGEVIIPPPVLVQAYPGFPFNDNFQVLNN